MDIIIAFLLGFLSSLALWWLLNHYFVPQITFSAWISKLTTDDSPSGFRYRIKLQNIGRRDAIDLKILVRLRVQGLRTESRWEISKINVKDSESVPFIRPMKSYIVRLYPEDTEKFASDVFPAEIQRKYKKRLMPLVPV